MAAHEVSIEPILSFYEDRGILIEYKMRDGFEGYDKFKTQVMYNSKH